MRSKQIHFCFLHRCRFTFKRIATQSVHMSLGKHLQLMLILGFLYLANCQSRTVEAFCNVLLLLSVFFVLPYFTHFLLFILDFSLFFFDFYAVVLCCNAWLFGDSARCAQKKETKERKKKLYIHTTYVIHIYNFPSSTINMGTYTRRNKMREKKWKKVAP